MDPVMILTTLAIGLVAGVVGGLAGIGGSIIMLPALGLVIGYHTPDKAEHHLYMAAAMVVNAIVAFASWVQHRRAKAVRMNIVLAMAPAMMVSIGVGVEISNRYDGSVAKTGLIIFLFAFCAYTLFTTIRKLPDHEEQDRRGGVWLPALIGVVTGVLSGFLGIGGGILLVPLLALLAHVPLRQAIAASAAVMCVSSPVGAVAKLWTLGEHTIDGVPIEWRDALMLAFPIGLGALVGAMVGAKLTHKLKLTYLRLAIAIILAIAGARMAVSSGHKAATDEPEGGVSVARGVQSPFA